MTAHDDHERREVADGAPQPALADIVRTAVESAELSGAVQLACAEVALGTGDPLAFFEAAAGGDRFYWCQPAARVAMAGRGAVALVEAKGDDRFAVADQAIAEAFGRLHAPPSAASEGGVCFFGGFSFAPEPPPSTTWQAFPAARLVLPEVLVRRDAGGVRAFVSRLVLPGADPQEEIEALTQTAAEVVRGAGAVWRRTPEIHPDPASLGDDWGEGAEYAVRADRSHDVYRGQVAAALRAIDGGALEKVVLARSLGVRHVGRFDVEAFLASLVRIYPSCTVLAVGCGDDTLVAATPELLVRRQGDRVVTAALAGSAPRGRTPEEDEALGRALVESAKERAEHDAVVRAVRDALAPVCGPLSGPDEPALLRVEGIQHLSTPLEGRMRAGAPAPSVVALAGRLHPTPAVGGLPAEAARAFIEDHEGLERGWYAAPVGFVDATGAGEYHVALRSALIRNAPVTAREPVSHARLFAGAGIVAGSDPDQELRETRLKLRALLAPLTEI